MSYGTNSTLFGGDYWWYRYKNGTVIYFNGSYSINFVCNATTKADPDIAGPGVIASFLATASITVLVAVVPAFYELLDWLSMIKGKLWLSSPAISTRSAMTSILTEAATRLLGFLCDLQIITAFTIVVAGLAQYPNISFYHENIAVNYWWLCINSFLAARIEYMTANLEIISARVTIRRAGVLVSVVLGLVFQCIINIRESRDWNFLGEGACFLRHDRSTTWPWVAGAAVYAVFLLLIIIPTTRPWMKCYSALFDRGQGALIEWQKKSFHALHIRLSRPASQRNNLLSSALPTKAVYLVLVLISSSSVILLWLLRQFLNIWSFGDGTGLLLVFFYIVFLFWDAYEIIDVKLTNRDLINGNETHWGFGQILPLVLMVTIGYAAIDALQEASAKEKCKASTAITLQPSQL